MIDLCSKVGGYITSIKNLDTGEELIDSPTHNLVTASGIDLLLNGRQVSAGTSLISNFFMFTGSSDVEGFGFPYIFLGSGTSPTTSDMVTLQSYKSAKAVTTSTSLKGTATSIADGKWRQRLVKTISVVGSDLPVTEIGFGPNEPPSKPIFSRVLLKNPITLAGTYSITYDFFISFPYHVRTTTADLGGSGIPGELKMDESYYTGVGAVAIPKLAPGFDASSLRSNCWVGPDASTNVPIGILTPYCWPMDVLKSQCPMFSTDTTLDFGDDTSSRLPYQSNGYCTCTAGPYVAGQGYRDFTYTVSAAYPTASSGVLHIAYLNLRGLAMRFGSYVNGSWVGQTLNKDSAHKLVITLRYTYTAEGNP